MPVSHTSLIERIARVIAGRVVSINANGDQASAADKVDAIWRDYRDDALSVIRHHNWVWENLIHPRVQVKVEPVASLVARIEGQS